MKIKICIILVCIINLLVGINNVKFFYKPIKADAPPDSLLIFNDSLNYHADSVSVWINDETAELFGNSVIFYQESKINADSIFLNNKNEVAFAKGSISLLDAEQKVLGDSLIFSFSDKRGLLNRGAGKFEKGFYYGEEIRKIDNKTYDISNGLFTSCDAKYPHIFIKSKQMRVYLNDKVIVRPAVFYVNHFPVMFIPFGAFSIKRGRVSGFLIPTVSVNSHDGKYLKDIAYFYAYKDYIDVLLSTNIYEKTGWKFNLRTNYIKRYIFNGNINYEYEDRNNNRVDWQWSQDHFQSFENRSEIRARLNFASSKKILEFSDSIEERTEQFLRSNLSYNFYLGEKRLSFVSSYNHNLFSDIRNITFLRTGISFPYRPITEIIPFSNSKILKKLGVSYYFNFAKTAVVRGKNPTFDDFIHTNTNLLADNEQISKHNMGIKNQISASYKYKFLWFNLSHGMNYYENWYDSDLENNKYVRANAYNFNSSLNFTFYGVKYFKDFPITAIRHIVKPSIFYSYTPGFSKNNIYKKEPFSILSGKKYEVYNFSISQKWQMKLQKKNKGIGDSLEDIKNDEIIINDLLGLTTSFSFFPDKDKNKLTDLNHNFELKSISFKYKKMDMRFNQDLNLRQDIHNFGILNYNFSSSLSLNGKAKYTTYFPIEKNKFVSNELAVNDSISNNQESGWIVNDEKWSAHINYSFNYDNKYKKVTQNFVSFKTAFKLSANWQFNFNTSYNIETKKMSSYSIKLSRKFHCWKMDISIYKSDNYWNYYVNFFDIKLSDALKLTYRDKSH